MFALIHVSVISEKLPGREVVTAAGAAAGAASRSDTSPTVSPPTAIHPSPELAEPPVVARLVVEIRSDGTTTVARAGLLDAVNHERTLFEARGSTPLAVAVKLARYLVQLSLVGPRAAARSLLTAGPRRPPPR
ncbi:MAG: hypothetical protein ABIS92_09835 [Polyangia bacterium]